MPVRYIVATALAILASCTTIILFVVAHSGIWVQYVSATVFSLIYMGNFIFLGIVMIIYSWQRAKYKKPK